MPGWLEVSQIQIAHHRPFHSWTNKQSSGQTDCKLWKGVEVDRLAKQEIRSISWYGKTAEKESVVFIVHR